jgi:ATP-dependent DNA helicase RecQ
LPSPEEILQTYWGHRSFRSLQKEIIDSVLAGKDTLALLPTGGGKSICYQVPALLNEGICLVISPLIALMQDQVKTLKSMDVPAAALHAGMNSHTVRQTLSNALHGGVRLLYISPERLQHQLFREYLPELDISMVAVDEAHCVSLWGHDFRPDYLKIGQLREMFEAVPFLALTASATAEVQKDIATQLKLRSPQVFRKSFRRENLIYNVKYSENKNGDLIDALEQHPGSSIVYCRSRRQTETLARNLKAADVIALPYHAGFDRNLRETAQQSWMENRTRVMTATTAFGMGIDKADVRLVAHYDAPEDLAAWYQEAGRAGRDEKPAMALTLYGNADIKRLQESTALKFPPERYLRQVYQAVAEYLQIPTGTEPDRYFYFDLGEFCHRFGFETLPASNALRLLQQEGLWTISDSVFNPATLLFTTDRQALDHISGSYPELTMLITVLLRQYGTVFNYPSTIRLSVLARQLAMTQQQVEKQLLVLHSMGVLEYEKQQEGSRIYVHHFRVDSRHLIIDNARIGKLRKSHLERTHAMIAFLEGNQCREQALLSYFNEVDTGDCGHCDVCLSHQKQPAKPKDIVERLVAMLTMFPGQSLSQLLKLFPETDKDAVARELRSLIENKAIIRREDGSFSVSQPG